MIPSLFLCVFTGPNAFIAMSHFSDENRLFSPKNNLLINGLENGLIVLSLSV